MDFDDIAASVRIHFCPKCQSSFGCVTDGDGDCEGAQYSWNKPWCPSCVQKEECTACPRYNCRCDRCGECECSDCKDERRKRDSGEGPYDDSGPSSLTRGRIEGYRRLWFPAEGGEPIRTKGGKRVKTP